MIRKATNNNKKAIKKWQECYNPKEPIEDYDYDAAICRSLRGKFRYHFISPAACIEEWKDILNDNTQDCIKYKEKLWCTRILTPNATCTTHAGPLITMEGILGEGHYQSTQLSDRACKGVIETMVVWTMIMKDREEMHGSREEVCYKRKEKKKRKRKRKERAEKKGKECGTTPAH
jgi:hypothetical protein